MNKLSPLVNDDVSGLSYRALASDPVHPKSLLVLLHGVGGDETNLTALAAAVTPGTFIVLVRGRLALPVGFGWFHVAFTSAGPRIEAAEAEQSRKALIMLIGRLQSEYGIDRERTVIAGFSQGGILSASVGLSSPQSVAAFAVMSGRILPELEPAIAAPIEVARLHAFIAHGRQDNTLPVSWATRAQSWLENLHVQHVLKLFDGGHELTAEVATSFLEWLDQRLSVPSASAQVELEFDDAMTTDRTGEAGGRNLPITWASTIDAATGTGPQKGTGESDPLEGNESAGRRPASS